MLITRTSILSGTETTLDLNVTAEQLDTYARGGAAVQDVFPHLAPEEREFIKSGITSEEWAATFSDA